MLHQSVPRPESNAAWIWWRSCAEGAPLRPHCLPSTRASSIACSASKVASDLVIPHCFERYPQKQNGSVFYQSFGCVYSSIPPFSLLNPPFYPGVLLFISSFAFLASENLCHSFLSLCLSEISIASPIGLPVSFPHRYPFDPVTFVMPAWTLRVC